MMPTSDTKQESKKESSCFVGARTVLGPYPYVHMYVECITLP